MYSCSWGPSDDGGTLEAPGELTRTAIEYGATHGREGLGCVYVWAAGNGRDYGDTCSHDGYASNPHVIAVAAATYLGKEAWYSEGRFSRILYFLRSQLVMPFSSRRLRAETGNP